MKSILSSIPKILIVDDQPVNVKLLQFALEQNGMLVWPAYSGQQCLDQVNNEMPDLILLDIMMPEMDGFEVCKILKEDEATQAIPIIFRLPAGAVPSTKISSSPNSVRRLE